MNLGETVFKRDQGRNKPMILAAVCVNGDEVVFAAVLNPKTPLVVKYTVL